MKPYYTSPYEKLGYKNIKDIQIIRQHLSLPYVYQKVIFKNFPQSLSEVPILLPRLIEKIHDKLWSDLMSAESIEFLHKLYKVAGIPPQLILSENLPNGKRDQMKLFHYVTENITRFVSSGNSLYIHSDNETNALLASAQMVKAAVREKIPACMVSFGSYVDSLKSSFEGGDKALASKVENSKLVCFYFVGAEYSTDFSDCQLKLMLSQRQAAGLPTIVSSFLSPEDYKKRYKAEVNGTVVRYDDEKISKTIGDLLKELEGK